MLFLRNLIVFIIFIVATSFQLKWKGSKDYTFFHYKVEEGLGSNTVISICQDRNGFLWVGTGYGLSRFDGYSFKNYYQEPNETNCIPNNTVVTLLEDRSGQMWIGTINGLASYNPDMEKFRQFGVNNADFFPNSHITKLYEDSNGLIWIGTYGGVIVYDPFKDVFDSKINTSNSSFSLLGTKINTFQEDGLGRMWIGTSNGVVVYYPEEQEIRQWSSEDAVLDQFIKTHITSIIFDHDEAWVASRKVGLLKFNMDTEEYRIFESFDSESKLKAIANNSINTMMQVRNGDIWIGTRGGLSVMDKETETFTNIYHDPLKPSSLAWNVMLSLFEDQSGGVWIGTYGAGLDMWHPLTLKFRGFGMEAGSLEDFAMESITSINAPDEQTVWVSGYGPSTLQEIDLRERKVINHFDDTNFRGFISHIHADRKKPEYLWLGTESVQPQLIKYNIVTREIEEEYSFVPQSLTVESCCEDANDNLWFGTTYGVIRFNKLSGESQFYTHDPDNVQTLSYNGVSSIIEAESGELWVATTLQGLNRLNPVTGKVTRYLHDEKDSTSLVYNRVTCLAFGKDGRLWIGTQRGFCCYDDKKDAFIQYNKENGFISGAIQSIEVTSSGEMWISSSESILKFNPENDEMRSYKVVSSLDNNYFNIGSSTLSPQGQMFFGGSKGVISFHPQDIIYNFYQPPVLLTGLDILNEKIEIGDKVNKRVLLDRALFATDTLIITYKEKIITLEFAALNFLLPQNNNYAYKLLGFDNEWQYIGNRRSVTFTNLDHGKYTLLVKGSNNDNVWNDNYLNLTLIVKPPFYKTTWFKTLGFTLIALLLYSIYMMRVQYLKQKARELQKLVDKRTFALKETNVKLESYIEQQKKMQDQLIQSEKLASIGTLTAGIAHEINNPINFINSGINSLKLDFEDIESIVQKYGKQVETSSESNTQNEDSSITELLATSRETIEEIKYGVLRMSQIVSGLQNYARVGDKQKNLINIVECIESSLLLSLAGHSDRIEVNKSFDDSIQEIYAYGIELSQAFVNIFSNSIDAILICQSDDTLNEKKGLINVSTKKMANNHIEITIRDNGCGIKPTHLNKVFDPFFTTKDIGKGTGIGLSITHSIIKKHDGDIRISSLEGEETCVVIKLPI